MCSHVIDMKHLPTLSMTILFWKTLLTTGSEISPLNHIFLYLQSLDSRNDLISSIPLGSM